MSGPSREASPRPAAADAAVRRARLEEVQPLAAAYRREAQRANLRLEPPLPTGAVFWIAELPDGAGAAGGAQTPDSAARGATPIGYAAGTLRPEGLVLGPLYVDPDHRRGGVASKLLADIERWAAGASIPLVEVSVAADNADGVAFLESAGFFTRRLLMSREAGSDPPPRTRRARGATPR